MVREADLDGSRARDHVVVRDDVAGLVDDEARAECSLRLAGPEGVAEEGIRGLLDARRRLDVHDGGRRGAIDLVDRPRFALLEDGRRGGARSHVLPDDRRLVPELPERGRTAERDATPEKGGGKNAGEGARKTEAGLHVLVLAGKVLTRGCAPLSRG